MKNILFLILFCLMMTEIYAQQKAIMVCNPSGANCSQYDQLDLALQGANPGDYIYIPGGIFTMNIPVDKEVHMIGAGFNPDSTQVTGPTMISGNLILSPQSRYSSFEGFGLTGGIGTTNSNNDTIRDCQFVRLLITGECYGMPIRTKWYQCVFKNVVRATNSADFTIDNEQSGVFANCIFEHYLYRWRNTQVTNCLFLRTDFSVHESNYMELRNNVFTGYIGSYSGTSNGNCMASNNLSILGSNNITFILQNKTLTGNCSDYFLQCPSATYDPAFSYKLKPGCNAIGAGTDGKDIGIYGGDMPWVDGSIPGNPHFFSKNIGSTTNGTGHLPVQIKVRAQQQ